MGQMTQPTVSKHRRRK